MHDKPEHYCNTCDKAFAKKKALVNHWRLHKAKKENTKIESGDVVNFKFNELINNYLASNVEETKLEYENNYIDDSCDGFHNILPPSMALDLNSIEYETLDSTFTGINYVENELELDIITDLTEVTDEACATTIPQAGMNHYL